MKENADRARALDANELAKQLRDGAEQMFRLRFQMSMGQMEGVKKYRSLRKERARMLTVVQERAAGGAALKAVPPAPKIQKPAAPKRETAPKPKPVSKTAAPSKPAVKRAVPAPKAASKPAAAQKPRKSSKG